MILSVQSSEEAIAAAKRALENHKQFWFGNAPGNYGTGPIGPRAARQCFVPFIPFRTQPLYAFCWKSREYGKLMYFKFGIGGSRRKPQLAVYSFHESKR
jgi:hypothetical protein